MFNPIYRTVPLDEEGMRLDILEEILKRDSPKFIYTMPNFHNPTGITMSLERRKILLDLAIKYKTLIIENDVYGELRYKGQDIPPLKALPGGEDHVIYISSFSKILLPSLRVGWMIVPNGLIKHVLVAKYNSTHRSNQWIYHVLFEFCNKGYLKNHLNKIKGYYQDKLESILIALENYFPDGILWTKPEGGYSIWITLPEEMDSKMLLFESVKRKVSFLYGSVFFPESGGLNNFRLAFTKLSIDQIEEGVKILGKIIEKNIKSSLSNRKMKSKNRLLPLG